MGADPQAGKVRKLQGNLGRRKEHDEEGLPKAQLEIHDGASDPLHFVEQDKEVGNEGLALEAPVQVPRRHPGALVLHVFQEELIVLN